ncbi:MAG TPA: hypothetical protein VFL64_01010 [Rhizobacter sp.]|nr:hypothetical protein [Rhizobacter sp.]
MYRCLIAAVATVTLVLPAAAQVQRSFPQNALRGTIAFGTPPQVVLNGKPTQLAPGARIRGLNNLLEMSGALVGAKGSVNYTIDQAGLVKDVWILRKEEIAMKPWPETLEQAQTWSFDPVAQTWTKP